MIDKRTLRDILDYYNFFETPDGQECLPKTYYYTKYAAITGSIFSVYEMVLHSQPKTLASTVARFGHFTLPFAGMGFAFGSTLCLISHLRKKDGVMNHVIAGAAAGSVWGFKYNRISTGHRLAIVFAFFAGYWKYFHVNNFTITGFRDEAHVQHYPKLNWQIKLYDDPGRPRN